MLHSLAHSTFDTLIRIGHKYSFHCFCWNSVGEVEVTTDPGKLFRWRILASVQVLYYLFVNARLYHSIAILGVPIEKCTIHVIFIAGHTFYAGTTFNSLRKRHEIAEFLTNFFRIDKLLKPLPHQVHKSKKFGEFIRLFYILCLSTGVFHAPLFLGLPRNPNFVFSVVAPYLADNRILYVGLECCAAIFEMFMGLAAWSAGAILYSITFCVVADCLSLWTEVMKYEVSWRPIPISRQRYYRIVQLLMTQFNDCFAYHAFLMITTLAYFGLILCSFAALRYYGKIPFLAYAAFPTVVTLLLLYTFLVYPAAGRAAESHKKMVKQWKYIESHRQVGNNLQYNLPTKLQEGEDKGAETDVATISRRRNWGLLAKKNKPFNKKKHNLAFIRSCNQIGFKVGPLFVVKPGTTLSVVDMVLDQLINCLISF